MTTPAVFLDRDGTVIEDTHYVGALDDVIPIPGAAEALARLAEVAFQVNEKQENIGARRLYTVMERVFEDLSFVAPDRAGAEVVVNAAFVDENLGELTKSTDLSRYVL